MAKRQGKSTIPTGKPQPEHRIIVLLGKEEFLRQEWTAAIRGMLVKAHGDIDTFRFDGDSTDAATVLDECRSFGLMSAHKLVVVDAADKMLNADQRPLFERYVAGASEGSTLLLRCDNWMPNEKKLLGAVQDAGGVFVDCHEVDEGKAIVWCGRRAKTRHETSIEKEAAEMLVARHGPKLAKLDSELAKLALGAGPEGITPDLVIQLGAGSRQDLDPFAATSELLSGNAHRAIHQIRTVLDTQARDGHVPAIWSAVSQAVRLHAHASGSDPKRVGRAHWTPAHEQSRVQQIARRAGRAGAKRLLDAALQLDANSKSGVGDPVRGLESLAVRFSLEAQGR